VKPNIKNDNAPAKEPSALLMTEWLDHTLQHIEIKQVAMRQKQWPVQSQQDAKEDAQERGYNDLVGTEAESILISCRCQWTNHLLDGCDFLSLPGG